MYLEKSMARQYGLRTGRCRGCNHLERVRLLAAGASIQGAARKFAIDYHALRRHWRNHVSAEARAAYIAGVGATKDQLEEIVADETLALIDHYRIVRGALYKRFGAAAELGDGNSLALLAGRLHENFRDCGRLTGELQRGPLLNIQNNVLINPDCTRAIARIVSAVAPYLAQIWRPGSSTRSSANTKGRASAGKSSMPNCSRTPRARCGATASSTPRDKRQRQTWRELLWRSILRRARVRTPMKPASSSSAETTRVTAMCWPMPRENINPSSGRKSRSPHIGRIMPTASSPNATTATPWSRRRSAWSTITCRSRRFGRATGKSPAPNRSPRCMNRAGSTTSAPSPSWRTRCAPSPRISIGPGQATRQTASMRWCGR